ncbi:unnamed protein product [Symbiodinium sp. CCMP2592]|nr:unnamed protein product [Symbiodinium sp. CCMP2592]
MIVLGSQAAIDFTSILLYLCTGAEVGLQIELCSNSIYRSQVAIDLTGLGQLYICTGAEVDIHRALKLVSPSLAGICSQKALKLNKAVMLSVASILCPQSKHKLGLNVGPLKKQAKQLRKDLEMADDPASVHCEGHAIKGFQTLINRRLFTSKKKRDSTLEGLYAVYRQYWTPTPEEIEKARKAGKKLIFGPEAAKLAQDQEAEADGNDDDECYDEEGGEEELLEDDAYLEPSDSSECIQDVDLGMRLGFTPRKSEAYAAMLKTPEKTPEPLPQTVAKPLAVPIQTPPSSMVSSYLDNSYLSSHLSPRRPRPTDTPIKTGSAKASASPGSPVKAVVPPPEPKLAEPMEAAADDARAERLARIALLRHSDRKQIADRKAAAAPAPAAKGMLRGPTDPTEEETQVEVAHAASSGKGRGAAELQAKPSHEDDKSVPTPKPPKPEDDKSVPTPKPLEPEDNKSVPTPEPREPEDNKPVPTPEPLEPEDNRSAPTPEPLKPEDNKSLPEPLESEQAKPQPVAVSLPVTPSLQPDPLPTQAAGESDDSSEMDLFDAKEILRRRDQRELDEGKRTSQAAAGGGGRGRGRQAAAFKRPSAKQAKVPSEDKPRPVATPQNTFKKAAKEPPAEEEPSEKPRVAKPASKDEPCKKPRTSDAKLSAEEKPCQKPRTSDAKLSAEEKPSKKPRTSKAKLPAEEKPSSKPGSSRDAAVDGKKTFARRYCPAEGRQGREKWLALKEVFEAELANKFRFPGKYEDAFWKYFTTWTAEFTLTSQESFKNKVLLLLAAAIMSLRKGLAAFAKAGGLPAPENVYVLVILTMGWLQLSGASGAEEERARQVAEMLRQMDEPMFAAIEVASSPATPMQPPAARLHRSGGRNVKNLDMSPGAWSLRHADTKCLGDTQADGTLDSVQADLGLPSDASKPVGNALSPTQQELLANAATPQSSLGSPSYELKPVEEAMSPTQRELLTNGATLQSSLPSPELKLEDPLPPWQPDPVGPLSSAGDTSGAEPTQDGSQFPIVGRDQPPASTCAMVPVSRPGKGKGGNLPEGRGKGLGSARSGPPGHEPEPEPKMMWAQGPDAAPMLAVEMQFDDGSYDECPEPPEELPVLSEGAVYKRMWRVFRPREDGSYLVPQSVVAEYKNLTSRPNVVRAFERCGFCPDKFVKKVNKTLESVEEVEVEEEWEFLTEEDVQELKWERIAGVKQHCEGKKGFKRQTLYDNKTMYWTNIKITGSKKKTQRSILRKMVEAEEEGTIEDNDLAMDFAKMDMSGADSSAPTAATQQGPSLAGVDKKTLQCFPDLEKVAVPSSIVPKAGLAIQKCLGKLSAHLLELNKCVSTELVKKLLDAPPPTAHAPRMYLRMTERVMAMHEQLHGEDVRMNQLYEQGMVDGYDGECVQAHLLDPRAKAPTERISMFSAWCHFQVQGTT